ncbi:putative 3,4-dihydroxy-2-butanone kinase isoform X2 [Odontomachus brunneus]|uniref:putative 3,4-dihydroxy-2-butanone kinase isoform X2 n=1 Tax=Odontomachus brunneus TaxID=486640 RepID=UPI0013F29DBB|nr:putative 3,4-dihydroxy-2-butanone kinase isoform X2 [Odontomachus brunneus]
MSIIEKYLGEPTEEYIEELIEEHIEMDIKKEPNEDFEKRLEEYAQKYIEQQNLKKCNDNKKKKEEPDIQIKKNSPFFIAISFACDALIACAKQLNIMGAQYNEGYYGDLLAICAKNIKTEMEENRISIKPSKAFMQISRVIESETRDYHSTTYSLFFKTAAESFKTHEDDDNDEDDEPLTVDMWWSALTSANQIISEATDLSVGDRSMMDALIPAELSLKDALDSGLSPVDAFRKAVEAAESSAEQTLNMPQTRLGYTLHQKFKYIDSESHAVCIWMRAAYEGFKLKFGN